jgi:hypothetical protein
MKPSQQIDQYIKKTGDWRGVRVAQIRKIALESATGIEEEWKWNSPVWSHLGRLISSTGAFKTHVGMNFFQGAALKDPKKLFNSGLEAKKSRSINFSQEDKIDAAGIKKLIREAIDVNAGK